MLFSVRNKQPIVELRSDFSLETRRRIFFTLQELVNTYADPDAFDSLLQEVQQMLLKQYGGLSRSSYRAARHSDDPMIEHFCTCSNEHFLDFIEACFRPHRFAPRERGVDPINAILREEGIAFELTPWSEREVPGPAMINGRRSSGKYIEHVYPQFVVVSDRFAQKEIMEPGLRVLSNPLLKVANEEFLKAHNAFRFKDYENTITRCASAFESVLKAVCAFKKWPFNSDRDTVGTLVTICSTSGLFPSYYVEFLKNTGTIRNKLGDAHGRGPMKATAVTLHQAEHMLNLTATNIVFIARAAGLE